MSGCLETGKYQEMEQLGMSKKKIILIYIVILLIAVSAVPAVIYCINISYPNCEMPCVAFSYRNDGNDIYIFDSRGNIYKISRFSGKTDGFVWLESTIKCLNEENLETWLEKVGTTDQKVLRGKYNIFRKIVENPKYSVFCTEDSVPCNSSSFTDEQKLTDYWYGHTSETDGIFFYYTGRQKYDVRIKESIW